MIIYDLFYASDDSQEPDLRAAPYAGCSFIQRGAVGLILPSLSSTGSQLVLEWNF